MTALGRISLLAGTAALALACQQPPPPSSPYDEPVAEPGPAEELPPEEAAEPAPAEPETPPEPPPPPELSQADKDFVKTAGGAGMAEVELSKLALEKAKKPAIKDFAQRMVDDHGKANEELMAFATKRGAEMPAELPAEAEKTRKDLEKLTGTKFEKKYLAVMLEDHQKAVDLFTAQSEKGEDAELKAWAATTLPTLQEHLEHVRNVVSGKATAAAKAEAKPEDPEEKAPAKSPEKKPAS